MSISVLCSKLSIATGLEMCPGLNAAINNSFISICGLLRIPFTFHVVKNDISAVNRTVLHQSA